MAHLNSDYLRHNFLLAYVRGENTLKQLSESFLVSERGDCPVLCVSYRRRSSLDPQIELQMRIREIAPARARNGYHKIPAAGFLLASTSH
ncbi:MAG: hypothetical protein ABSD67_22840 [Terracidiphilus sp.]|jgi:hypothetical protein